MSDITKKANPNISRNQRSQRFDLNDADEGDVILVKESIGHPAKHVTITCDDAFGFRFNVYKTVFPERTHTSGPFNGFWDGLKNLTSGVQVLDEQNAELYINNETIAFHNDIPVSDIQILMVSGNWTIDVF